MATLVKKIEHLRYEDTICDLLYQFKYMFVGYSLKAEAEQAIEKFPQSMREKLKFLLTHSSTVEMVQQHNLATVIQQQQHHQQQQNPYLLQQMVATSNLSLNTSSNSLTATDISQNNLSMNDSFVGQQHLNNTLLNNSSNNMEIEEKDENLIPAAQMPMGINTVYNFLKLIKKKTFGFNFPEKFSENLIKFS